jgi:aldehyde dehydrogenase (NAD+)
MEEMINQHFDSKILRVINGGVETAQDLLKIPFDYIFFTGGTKVGKLVMKAAADHLTPVTLELGGKSPAIVDETADLDVAASRIVWGKFFNAGQTCIAPDYVLAQEIIYSDLIHRLKEKIIDYYGIEPQKSADFARIINDKHFSRLQNLINPEKVVHGGQVESSTRYIAPTILEKVDLDDAVMNEEIFGPILPVLMYRNFEQAFDIIQKHPNPLALYLFTRNKNTEKRVISEVPYGGGCINDVISHNFNEMLPFGGRGTSGMGAYHGEYSFNTFSHDKSILHRKNWPDFSIRYPPHKVENRLMRVFFKIASWLI